MIFTYESPLNIQMTWDPVFVENSYNLCNILFQEKDRRFLLTLDNIKVKDLDSGFMSKRQNFALFNVEGRNVYKDHKG